MVTLGKQIIDVAIDAGQIILDADRTKIGIKDKAGKANFVTEYDCKVQDFIQEKLASILPEAVFLGEEDINSKENGKQGDVTQEVVQDAEAFYKDKEYVFVVDPIDGTTNFIKDYHMSCISIGLVKNGERYFGVVHNPYLNETFYAEKGKGAWLNYNESPDTRLHVSKEDLSNGIVLFGSSPYNVELAKASFDLAYEYFTQALDIRRSGSAAIDLCSIAAGRAELYFEMILSPWDYAAGALIVEEAGGIVTTLEGDKLPCFTKASLIAKNKK